MDSKSNKMKSMDRLNPNRNSSRYYILTLLKKVNEEVVQNISRSHVILDFGCGAMPYKPLYIEKCNKYIGVDFEGNLNADLFLIDGKIPLESESVDVVISTQVLEHVTSPNEYLQECYRVLKKNGLLILSTHGHWKYHPDPTDYWRWTQDGLIKVIESNEFKVNSIYGLMGLAASGLQLFQDGISSKIPNLLKGTFFRLIAFLQIRMDKWRVSSKDASVHLTVSQKV